MKNIGILALVAIASGCTPAIHQFGVELKSAPPVGKVTEPHYTCPSPDDPNASLVRLKWKARGRTTLEVHSGHNVRSLGVPSSGTHEERVEESAQFELAADRDALRKFGLPRKERQEVKVVGPANKPRSFVGPTVCVGTTLRAELNKDTSVFGQRVMVDTVSLGEESVLGPAFDDPTTALTIRHGGKTATLSKKIAKSDELKGVSPAGPWVLEYAVPAGSRCEALRASPDLDELGIDVKLGCASGAVDGKRD